MFVVDLTYRIRFYKYRLNRICYKKESIDWIESYKSKVKTKTLWFGYDQIRNYEKKTMKKLISIKKMIKDVEEGMWTQSLNFEDKFTKD